MLLRILVQLTDAGLTLAKVREIGELTAKGDTTLPERLGLFRAKRAEIEGRIVKMREAVESLDGMRAYYERAIEAGGEAAVRDPTLL